MKDIETTYAFSNNNKLLLKFENAEFKGLQRLDDLYNDNYVSNLRKNYGTDLETEFVSHHVQDFNYFAQDEEQWKNYINGGK